MKKYYEILGLDMSASIAEVEQAYRKLSDVWRPQTYQNLPRYRRKAEIKSKEITARLQKESEAEPFGESAGQKYVASTDKPKIVPQIKTDYNALLTEEALSKYNQDSERVKRAQRGLIANGYDTGPLDGIIGPQTIAALKQFASDHAVEADGLFASDLTSAVLVYAEVAATHPDWHSIIGSEDFARWLDRQSYYQTSTIQNFKKSATARQVIDILNRYKFDKATP